MCNLLCVIQSVERVQKEATAGECEQKETEVRGAQTKESRRHEKKD